MKILDFSSNVNQVEINPLDGKPVRNRWQWKWMEETNKEGQLFKACFKKIDEPGKCFCVVCNQTLTYGSSGKKALMAHANICQIILKKLLHCFQIPNLSL